MTTMNTFSNDLIPQELIEVGVPHGITPELTAALDELGFAIVPSVITGSWLEQLQRCHDELIRREGADQVVESFFQSEFHKERGARRLADLVNKGDVFDGIWLHPLILSAAWSVIRRPFKLSALSSREAISGEGGQGLHSDWGARGNPQFNHVFIAIVVLDGFTAANGATRLIPGTHRLPGNITDVIVDPLAPHHGEVLPVCPAGSVILMNSHLWHGGTVNRSGERRRVLHVYYCAREHDQQLNQRQYLRKATWDRLTPAQRWVLDVE